MVWLRRLLESGADLLNFIGTGRNNERRVRSTRGSANRLPRGALIGQKGSAPENWSFTAMTHFNTAVAHKAKTIASIATLRWLSHRRSNLFGAALGLSVFIFESGSRLFKIVQGVQYRLDLLLSITILRPFPNFVQLFRDFCRRCYERQSTRNSCDWFHEADFTPSDLIL
jgi:hypothetical protein